MNAKSPNGISDRDLEQLARVYKALGADEPPELLDRAVLNAARRETERRRHWAWNLGWYHTVGTAAGVLLVVGVYLQMRDEAPELPPPAEPVLRDAVRAEGETGTVARPDLGSEMRAIDALRERRPAEELEQDASATQSMEAAPAPVARQSVAPQTDDEQAKRALLKAQGDEEQIRDADQWFEDLKALKVTGEETIFLQQLEAFRKTYPDFPLPEDWPD